MEQLLHRGSIFCTHHEDARQAEEHANGSDKHRRYDRFELHHIARGSKSRSTEGCRGEDTATVALVEVCSHACHVAYIVAYIIRDRRGVARIILGDVSFHLSHEVSTHIGRLGIDAAADTRKERLRGSAHAKGQHRRSDGDEGCLAATVESMQDKEPHGDVEQAETYHDKSHNSTGAERYLQSFIQPLTSRVGCAPTGIGRGLHAKETGKTGEEATREESERHPGVLHMKAIGHDGKDGGKDDKDDQHYFILLFEISHGTPAHIASDLLHPRGSFFFAHHPAEERPCHDESRHRCQGDKPENQGDVFHNHIVFRG